MDLNCLSKTDFFSEAVNKLSLGQHETVKVNNNKKIARSLSTCSYVHGEAGAHDNCHLFRACNEQDPSVSLIRVLVDLP